MQGPLVDDSIKTIRIYRQFANVVVSCWNTDNPRLIQAAANEANDIIVNTFLEESKAYNFQNIKYQIQTTLEGAKKSKTDHIVKVRSDEYFTNCEPIIKSVLSNPDKMTVCNFLFRKGIILHPSDHIIGGDKEKLIDMLENASDMIKDYKFCQQIPMTTFGLPDGSCYKLLTAESTLCLSWLKTMGLDFLKESAGMDLLTIEHYYRKVVKKYYSLVTASNLGHFLFRYKSNPRLNSPTAFTNEQQFLQHSKVESISSLDDICISALRERESEDYQ